MSLQRNALKTRIYAVAFQFTAWLTGLSELLIPAPFRLMQIGSAFWQSRALAVAARLDIATVLGNETLAVGVLAAKLDVQPDPLFRLLRMLASLGIFHETTQGVFGNNRLSHCLRTDHPQCVRPMILLHNAEAMSRPWYEQLEPAIRSGQVPFKLAYGEALYGYMERNPGFAEQFKLAMDSVEALMGDSFATEFDWRAFDRVIDIGGSRGAKSVAILRRHPHLKALVVDCPQAIQGAEAYWRSREPASLTRRLAFAVGDMLEGIPQAISSRDVYLLSAVLHGCNDETSCVVLRNLARVAAPADARIVLLEMVLAESHPDSMGCAFDMQMMVNTEGRERTLSQWKSLITASGLQLQQNISLASPARMLVLQVAPKT